MEKGNLYIVRTQQPNLFKALENEGIVSYFMKLEGDSNTKKDRRPGRPKAGKGKVGRPAKIKKTKVGRPPKAE